jgi:Flp pilus assembly protein CpaB
VQQSLTTRLLGESGSKLLSSRKGAILLGAAAALLAAILLIVYVNRYRTSLKSNVAPTPVLVAKRLIQKGTPAATFGPAGLYQLTEVPKKDVKDGAVADPATIKGRIAVDDIYPGQQLTVDDFTLTPTAAIPTRISGDQRAVAVQLDSTHGLVGQVAAGDHVDVYIGINANVGGVQTPVIALLYPNVFVMSVAGGAGSGIGASGATKYILRLRTDQVPKMAYAADHGQLWFVARPSSGAAPTKPQAITANSLLFAAKVNVGH